MYAAEVLGDVNPRTNAVTSALKNALKDKDIVVRRSAAKALTSMGKTPQGTASPWVPIE